MAEETIANDEVVVIKGGQSGQAVSVLLRGANDYMLDEMDRSLHDSFCVVKRVLESGAVVPGMAALLLAWDSWTAAQFEGIIMQYKSWKRRTRNSLVNTTLNTGRGPS